MTRLIERVVRAVKAKEQWGHVLNCIDSETVINVFVVCYSVRCVSLMNSEGFRTKGTFGLGL